MAAQPVHSDGDADVLRELHQAVQATPPLKSGEVDRLMDAALAAETATVREAELLVAAASDYERTEILLHKLLRGPATEAEIAEKLEWTVDRTRYVAKVVADARLRHDEELLAFMDPADAADFDGPVDGEER